MAQFVSDQLPRIASAAAGICAGAGAGAGMAFGLEHTLEGVRLAAAIGAAGFGLAGWVTAVNVASRRRTAPLAAQFEALSRTCEQQNARHAALQESVHDLGATLAHLALYVEQMSAQTASSGNAKPGGGHEIGADLPAQSNAGDADLTESLAGRVAGAVQANRMDLYVQPTVTLPARRTAFFECLTRLREGDGQTMYPATFYAEAQAQNLLPVIDNFVLLRAVQIARRLSGRTSDKALAFKLFVNLSSQALMDADFFTQFIEFMMSERALAGQLVFECDASEWPRLPKSVIDGLAQLSQAGFEFCLDHAGVDALDAVREPGPRFAFVKAPAHVLLGPDAATYRAIVEASGATVIAARVEDDKSVIELIDAGVDYAQGYGLASPRPWNDTLATARRAAA